MGLFDTIERLNIADEQAENHRQQAERPPIPSSITAPIREDTAITAPKASSQQHDQGIAEANHLDTWTVSPAEIEERGRIRSKKAEVTTEQRAHFAAAWPWIKENKGKLSAAGWTMAALTRRSSYRWPCGPWGVAWLSPWSKPGLAVSIGQRGEIVFTFPSGGRMISQAAYPPAATLRI